MALDSAVRIMKAANLIPQGFSFQLSEDEAEELLTVGMEILRMIKDGDDGSDDERARELYERFFRVT